VKKSGKTFRLLIRILATLATIGYILFLIDEKVALCQTATFADITVYILAVVFLIGFIILWKNEYIAGIVWVAWYALQWILVLWIWVDGEMTLIFGFPIFIIGILALIYGIRHKGVNPNKPGR